MNKFFRVFKYIYIHPLLWVVIAIGVMTAHFYELCLLLFIIFTHELGHAMTASFFSWRIKRISLLPFGGVAEMDEHGNRPIKEEAWVILSGPLQHIWMIALGYILYQNDMMPSYLYQVFMDYNFMILLFNLLPIWPLDGGKLLFLILSLDMPFPSAHKTTLFVSMLGTVVFFLVVVAIIPNNLNAWIIISFLIFSIYYEWKQSRYVFIRFLLERYYGHSNEIRKLVPIEVAEDDKLYQVLEHFRRGSKHSIIVHNSKQIKYNIDENELLHAYFSDKLVSAKISDILYLY